MGINMCSISGNLVRDAELRATKGGTQVLTFTVAVNDRRRDPQTGEWSDYPNFIDCTVFGKRAESLARLVGKGSKVCVSGKLRWSQWEDKSGQKRSKVEVVADDVELMSQREAQNGQNRPMSDNYAPQGQNGAYSPSQRPQMPNPAHDLYDEDVPF